MTAQRVLVAGSGASVDAALAALRESLPGATVWSPGDRDLTGSAGPSDVVLVIGDGMRSVSRALRTRHVPVLTAVAGRRTGLVGPFQRAASDPGSVEALARLRRNASLPGACPLPAGRPPALIAALVGVLAAAEIERALSGRPPRTADGTCYVIDSEGNVSSGRIPLATGGAAGGDAGSPSLAPRSRASDMLRALPVTDRYFGLVEFPDSAGLPQLPVPLARIRVPIAPGRPPVPVYGFGELLDEARYCAFVEAVRVVGTQAAMGAAAPYGDLAIGVGHSERDWITDGLVRGAVLAAFRGSPPAAATAFDLAGATDPAVLSRVRTLRELGHFADVSVRTWSLPEVPRIHAAVVMARPPGMTERRAYAAGSGTGPASAATRAMTAAVARWQAEGAGLVPPGGQAWQAPAACWLAESSHDFDPGGQTIAIPCMTGLARYGLVTGWVGLRGGR